MNSDISRYLKYARKFGVMIAVRSIWATVWFKLHGVQCSVIACEGTVPKIINKGKTSIGHNLLTRSVISRTELGTVESNAELRIGSEVRLNQGVTILASSYIEIGDGTLIGDFSAILDTNWHMVGPNEGVRSGPVVIGNNVWLGRGAVILPGSKIGDHSVVAAGSTVRGDVPPRSLVAGNPAKVLREIDIADENWRR